MAPLVLEAPLLAPANVERHLSSPHRARPPRAGPPRTKTGLALPDWNSPGLSLCGNDMAHLRAQPARPVRLPLCPSTKLHELPIAMCKEKSISSQRSVKLNSEKSHERVPARGVPFQESPAGSPNRQPRRGRQASFASEIAANAVPKAKPANELCLTKATRLARRSQPANPCAVSRGWRRIGRYPPK